MAPIELYRKKILELGPDPLREGADNELLWASMQAFILKPTTLDRNQGPPRF
ncbi:hypothetical protein M758_6G159700 [Ceratodon purpureus]|nr:hypothetical protein M758_6G159700 [Ceratodon purpureus]